MKLLTEEELKNKKTSNTIFVLGSGSSINDVKQEHWDVMSSFNTIAFNWFCKHSFEPTFYLVREQANISSRKSNGETVKEFIRCLRKYTKSCCIICDVTHHTKKAYNYAKDHRIKLDRFIFKDDAKRRHSQKLNKYMLFSPVERGLIHGTCTLYNVMHFIKYLDYKRIVFVGVDLNDSRYFWLGNTTRHTVKKKGKTHKNKHAVAEDVLELVRKFKKFGIPMFVTNKSSLLTKVIPYENIEKIGRSIV